MQDHNYVVTDDGPCAAEGCGRPPVEHPDYEPVFSMSVPERLEYLRGEIRAERISYGEISELQSLADQIDPSDVELLEWAGVPEFPE